MATKQQNDNLKRLARKILPFVNPISSPPRGTLGWYMGAWITGRTWECGTTCCAYGAYKVGTLGVAAARRFFDRGDIAATGRRDFGLTEDEFEWLFVPESYSMVLYREITPSMVAERCEMILGMRGVE